MKQLIFGILLSTLMLVGYGCSEGDNDPIKVTSITLSKESVSIAPGDSHQLTIAEVLPAEATDKSVTWSSSEPTIVTVNQTGLVTVLVTDEEVEDITITATANDGSGIKAVCTVTIISESTIMVTSIVLNSSAVGIAPDNSYQLVATEILPADATNKSITWSSSNPDVAAVDQTGLVSIPATVNNGSTADIKATANDGSGVEATCTIVVNEGTITVNGIIWATCNVDMPGTFTEAPEVSGMLYQWGRKIGWSSSEPMTNTDGGTTWDDTFQTGSEWASENNPCPAGWRIPAINELNQLLDTDKVTSEWVTINSVNGYNFTDNTSNSSVFLPAAGYRDTARGGVLYYKTLGGAYWSSTSYNDETYSYCLPFTDQKIYTDNPNHRGGAFSIRCVLQ